MGLAGDRYTVLVTGRVKPGSGIARVELESADGRIVQTAFGNDAFLAELPDAPRAGKGWARYPAAPTRPSATTRRVRGLPPLPSPARANHGLDFVT